MMSETELYGDKVQCKCGGWHLHPCGTAKGAASWRSHQDTQQHNHHGGKKQTRHVARFDAEEEAARNLARNQRSYAYGGGGYMNDGNAATAAATAGAATAAATAAATVAPTAAAADTELVTTLTLGE